MERFSARAARFACAAAVSLLAACHDPQPLSLVAPDASAGAPASAARRSLLARVDGSDVVLTNEGAFPVRVRLSDARELASADGTPCGTECPVVFPGTTVRIATSAVRGFSAATLEVAVTWWVFTTDGASRRPGDAASAIVAVSVQ